jgi:hypothetical protein
VLVQQKVCDAYSLDYFSYPYGSVSWKPLPFLLEKLNDVNNEGNNSTSSNLVLIFNKQWGVFSYLPNDDPFYRTLPDSEISTGLYGPANAAQALVCREHFRFYARADLVNTTGDQFEIEGVPMRFYGAGASRKDLVENILSKWRSSLTNEVIRNETVSQTQLILDRLLYSPIADAVGELQGAAFAARSTLVYHGIQFGEPTTRVEVVRWFGSSVLKVLGFALFLTSGETDWGYGRLSPSWPGSQFGHWACESTLRNSNTSTSFGVVQLAILLTGCVIVISISYVIDPILNAVVSRKANSKSGLGAKTSHIRNQLLRHRLHSTLQLHRIAIEKTYGTVFTRTLETIPEPVDIQSAPAYGLKRRQASSIEAEELNPSQNGPGDIDGGSDSHRDFNGEYATMVNKRDGRSDVLS